MDKMQFTQAVTLALPAAWLTLGVRDNIFHPDLNESFTAEVLTHARLKQTYPQAYDRVAHRDITNRTVQKLAFYLIVVAEIVTALVMWVGVGALMVSALGEAVVWVRDIALFAALMFTAIWAMFTIVGNHFSYWFCHEGAQNTHFHLVLWGMATLVLQAL